MAALIALDNEQLKRASRDRMPPGGKDSIILGDEFLDDKAFENQETEHEKKNKTPEKFNHKKVIQPKVILSPTRRNMRRPSTSPSTKSNINGVLDHRPNADIDKRPRSRGAVGGQTTINHCLNNSSTATQTKDASVSVAGIRTADQVKPSKKKVLLHPTSKINECLDILAHSDSNKAALMNKSAASAMKQEGDRKLRGQHGGGSGGRTTILECFTSNEK